MYQPTNLGITKIGKLKLNEIARGVRSSLVLASIRVSDRRVLVGDIVNYIDSNLEGNVVETVPLLLLCQVIQNQPLITFVGYLDVSQLPYPNFVPQSFGLYDSDGDMIFCSNIPLSNFSSRFVIGSIDLNNVTEEVVTKITGNGLYNDILSANRIFQLLTTPPDGSEENSLYCIRSLNGTINKVGVKLGNDIFYLGYDEVTGTIVSVWYKGGCKWNWQF